MKYEHFLAARIKYNCILGIVLSVLYFTYQVEAHYKDTLSEAIAQVSTVTSKKEEMKNDTIMLEDTLNVLNNVLPGDFDKLDPKSRIIQTLDQIKARYPDVNLTFEDFMASTVSVEFPLGMAFKKDLPFLITYLQYVETLRLPFYSITNLSVTKEGDDVVSCKITGALSFPVTGWQGKREG
ncbi:MAG: hypothetical protein HQK89_06050 [Nitrospirae bacterium]|nr:hypothetical protein [Nitrospirota bacterium]